MKPVWLVLLACLSSCTTTVTSLNDDQVGTLSSERGYILLGVDTNRTLDSVQLKGPQNIKLTSKDVRKGTNYLLVDLEAGTYTFSRLSMGKMWKLKFDDDNLWSVTIKPGVISYVGHLEVVDRGSWFPVFSTELANRSSEALEFLESHYPKILAQNPLNYAGPGEDQFLHKMSAFISEAKNNE